MKPPQFDQLDNSAAIKNLQQKIMEANFSEPRSLFGGLSKGNTVSAFNSSASKKRKIMGLPFNYASDCKAKAGGDSEKKDIFGLNLETVQEKGEKVDKNLTIDISSLGEKKKGLLKSQLIGGGVTKKIIKGGVVTTQPQSG